MRALRHHAEWTGHFYEKRNRRRLPRVDASWVAERENDEWIRIGENEAEDFISGVKRFRALVDRVHREHPDLSDHEAKDVAHELLAAAAEGRLPRTGQVVAGSRTAVSEVGEEPAKRRPPRGRTLAAPRFHVSTQQEIWDQQVKELFDYYGQQGVHKPGWVPHVRSG